MTVQDRGDNGRLLGTAWAFGLYFSLVWGMILRQSMRATQVAVREILATAVATVVLVTIYMQVASAIGFSRFQEAWTSSVRRGCATT